MASAADQIVTAATDTAPRSGTVRATVRRSASASGSSTSWRGRRSLAGLDASAWAFAAIEIEGGSP